jgi:hypothetical protein
LREAKCRADPCFGNAHARSAAPPTKLLFSRWVSHARILRRREFAVRPDVRAAVAEVGVIEHFSIPSP